MRYLNFLSYNPIKYKRGVINSLVDRAILLSDKTFHQDNLNLIRYILEINGYPTKFVNYHIKHRLNALQRTHSVKINNKNNNTNIYTTLPYDHSIEHSINKILKPLGVTPAWTSLDATRCLFSKLKDEDEKMSQSNLVYRIDCLDCNNCYIGETKQYLHKRIYQHEYHVRKKNANHSGLCKHSIEQDHTFSFNEAKILHKSPQYNKRITLESLYIHKHSNNVNIQNEIPGLNIFMNLI